MHIKQGPTNRNVVKVSTITFLGGLMLLYYIYLRVVETGTAALQRQASTAEETSPKRPLQIFPLLKEFNTGIGNMVVPEILKRDASGERVLVVDVGLDKGKEFFAALSNGFEVVGFEPNPKTFPILADKCANTHTCHIVDLEKTPLPLMRSPGHSYLINAGVGKESATLDFSISRAVSSFTPNVEGFATAEKARVRVVRLDEIIMEDIYLLKVDTQGFDYFALQGAQKIFDNHVVRQTILENDPWVMQKNGVTTHDVIELTQSYGLVCFASSGDETKEHCRYNGDSVDGYEKVFYPRMEKSRKWGECWDDFLCINIEKEYTGAHPRAK